MKKLRVIIANDHTLVSAAIRSFLESHQQMDVLASVRIGPLARQLITRKRPDLLFMYLGQRGYDGLERAEKFLKGLPRLPVILLTVNRSNEYVSKALRIGAKGLLPMTAQPGELAKAVRAASNGRPYLSPQLPKVEPTKSKFEKLTPRQRSVLRLMAEGKSTKEVAKSLGLSPKTVEFHRARLMERVEIYDVPGLVRLAARVGLVSIDQ
jgi:DNA-binding NarL/FixJ family response regulator